MQLPSPKKRIEFIDLLRGWAVIVMVETHVFNATLPPSITESPFFQIIRFIDGLVAPAFLFASGMAYAVTTRRKMQDYLSFGTPLLRQVGRLLFILLIGYSLHIPTFNYYHLRYEEGPLAWQTFWQSDILQCIAVSLLFLQAMLLILRSEARLYRTMIPVTAFVVLASPLVWGTDYWNFMPVPLASFLNGLHYSLFPLFPWSAFLFAGALSGYYYLRARDAQGSTPEAVPAMMKRSVYVAFALVAVSFLLHPVAAALYPTYDYWKFSPSFWLLRLGLVMLLCAGMYFYEKRAGVSARSVVALMGRESLLVYATHLLLVYGKFGYFTFTDRVNRSFSYGEAILTTLVLLGLMYALALAWSAIKASPPPWKRLVQGVVMACFVLVFFFGPN